MATRDKAPATIRLKEVPITAEELLELNPATRYIVITVDKIPTRTAEAIGQKPFNIIGTNIKKINATVARIDTILNTPFFLPIIITRIVKSPPKNHNALSLFISAIKKSTSLLERISVFLAST